MSTIDLQKNPEFTKEPQWDMFRGNNHVRIVGHDIHHGGHVNLGVYVGRHLSDYLWNDLINRMWVNSIGIFGPGDGQWLIGHGPGHCKITLDKNDNISGISFTPTINYPQPYTEDELVNYHTTKVGGL